MHVVIRPREEWLDELVQKIVEGDKDAALRLVADYFTDAPAQTRIRLAQRIAQDRRAA